MAIVHYILCHISKANKIFVPLNSCKNTQSPSYVPVVIVKNRKDF